MVAITSTGLSIGSPLPRPRSPAAHKAKTPGTLRPLAFHIEDLAVQLVLRSPASPGGCRRCASAASLPLCLRVSASGLRQLPLPSALPCCLRPTCVGCRPSGSAILETQLPALTGCCVLGGTFRSSLRCATATDPPALLYGVPAPAYASAFLLSLAFVCVSSLRRRPTSSSAFEPSAFGSRLPPRSPALPCCQPPILRRLPTLRLCLAELNLQPSTLVYSPALPPARRSDLHRLPDRPALPSSNRPTHSSDVVTSGPAFAPAFGFRLRPALQPCL
jgi:hypothetical protein